MPKNTASAHAWRLRCTCERVPAGILLIDAESHLVVVEVESVDRLNQLMDAMLEAELNINYLYSFIPQPQGRSVLAMSLEDNELAEQILSRHQFRVLLQLYFKPAPFLRRKRTVKIGV